MRRGVTNPTDYWQLSNFYKNIEAFLWNHWLSGEFSEHNLTLSESKQGNFYTSAFL